MCTVKKKGGADVEAAVLVLENANPDGLRLFPNRDAAAATRQMSTQGRRGRLFRR